MTVSVVIMSIFLAFLAWLYRAGKIGALAMGIIVVSGFVLVVVTHYFYKRLWRDDES